MKLGFALLLIFAVIIGDALGQAILIGRPTGFGGSGFGRRPGLGFRRPGFGFGRRPGFGRPGFGRPGFGRPGLGGGVFIGGGVGFGRRPFF